MEGFRLSGELPCRLTVRLRTRYNHCSSLHLSEDSSKKSSRPVPPLLPLAWGIVGRTSGSILNLNILLGASDDVPHLGDLMFHQMLVKGVGDLQPTDERDGSHVVIAVIHHRHLALKIIEILLEALLRLYINVEEVVDVFL